MQPHGSFKSERGRQKRQQYNIRQMRPATASFEDGRGQEPRDAGSL